jgi:hypothetical protein
MKKIILIVLSLVLVFSLVGCSTEPRKENAQEIASKQNEKAVNDLISNDTLPTISKSLDRANIKKRAEFLNQPDRIGYLYLLSDSGQLIKEVQVLGKATSLNSYMTPMEEVAYNRIKTPYGTSDLTYVTEAPDLDGTWGTRPEGVFWFTPDEVYQEWNMGYFYSSERMTFTTKPLLIENVK